MPYLLADQCLDQTCASPEDDSDAEYDKYDRKYFTGNIERFDDLITDRAKGYDGHIERIERRPAFENVVAECAERHQCN